MSCKNHTASSIHNCLPQIDWYTPPGTPITNATLPSHYSVTTNSQLLHICKNTNSNISLLSSNTSQPLSLKNHNSFLNFNSHPEYKTNTFNDCSVASKLLIPNNSKFSTNNDSYDYDFEIAFNVDDEQIHFAPNYSEIISTFLYDSQLYEFMAYSNKVVILDSLLPLDSAVNAMISNSVTLALAWNSNYNSLLGLCTSKHIISTFLDISNDSIKFSDKFLFELFTLQSNSTNLPCLNIDDNLYIACQKFLENSLTKLPVFDPFTRNILYFLSNKEVLKALCKILQNINIFSQILDRTLEELKIDSINTSLSISLNTSLKEAFNLVVNLSPIIPVTENGVIIQYLTEKDVLFYLSNTQFSHLNLNHHSFNDLINIVYGSNRKFPVTCSSTDTLRSIIQSFEINNISSLFLENSSNQFLGIVTINDIIHYFLSNLK